MKEETLTKEESLALIMDMVGQAKARVGRQGSFYFLLWGWVVMLANAGHYVLGAYTQFEYPYMVWLIVIPAIVASIVYGMRQDRAAQVKGYFDHVYAYVWLAISFGILLTLIFMDVISMRPNAIILLLAATGTFISGQLIRFKPLTWGALTLWIGSICAFVVPIMDQYLVAAIAIALGYLVPGYLLRKQENE